MTDKHYNVLIPIVSLGDDNDKSHLLHVYSSLQNTPGDDAKALDAGLDAVVAPLLMQGLYRTGLTALGTVRKFGLKKPRMAFYQWFKPQAGIDHQRVRCVPAKGPTDGGSAELGIALSLLMGATDSRETWVIATGRLAPQLAGEAQMTRDRDAKVYPIGSLVEKLRLAKQNAKNNQLNANVRYFFIPETFNDGTLVTDNAAIQTLIKELADEKI